MDTIMQFDSEDIVTISGNIYSPMEISEDSSYDVFDLLDNLKVGEYFMYRDKFIYYAYGNEEVKEHKRACYMYDTNNSWEI
jgi:hypothetical protein